MIFLDRAAKKYPEEFKNYLKAELVSTSPPSAEETLSYVVLMDDVAMFQEFGLQENIRRCYFDTGDGEYSILESAIEHQSPKIFQHFLPLLTDADASEGEDGKKGVLKTLLLSASHKQSLEIVKTIFAAGEPWNGEDVVNAFAISVQNCATNIAEFLLKKVDDVSSLCVLCHEATMVDDLELATKIANKMRAIASSESSEKGDDVWLRVVRASGSLLIIDAIESNSLEFLQSIICDVDLASCDFEVKDDKKQTILTFAMSSTYEMVEALLVHQKNFLIKKYGKDQGEMEYKKFLDKKDEYDNASPLDVARRYTDNEETVYLLLREGANDKERANNRGQSPSAQAVPQGAAAAAAAKANIWQAP